MYGGHIYYGTAFGDLLFNKRSWLLAAVSSALIAVFLLYPEHRRHLFGLLPFAVLFACPLLRFSHGGHQHRQSGERRP